SIRNQGNCHKDDGNGNALGNLDLTSYENATRRADVLRVYGSYPVALLLLKASGKQVPPIPYKGGGSDQLIGSEINHVAANNLSVDSQAFFELQHWIANGATRDGNPVDKPKGEGT